MEATAVTTLHRLAPEILTYYELETTEIIPVKSWNNAVVRIESAGGRYALSWHRQTFRSEPHLQGELALLRHLANSGVYVPQPVPSKTGAADCRRRGSKAPLRLDTLAPGRCTPKWIKPRPHPYARSHTRTPSPGVAYLYFGLPLPSCRTTTQPHLRPKHHVIIRDRSSRGLPTTSSRLSLRSRIMHKRCSHSWRLSLWR